MALSGYVADYKCYKDATSVDTSKNICPGNCTASYECSCSKDYPFCRKEALYGYEPDYKCYKGPTSGDSTAVVCPGTCTTSYSPSGSKSGGCGDPHLALAHGGRADFKGEHLSWYNVLSAKNVSVNVLFVHAEFMNPKHRVHGSHMAKIAMVVRTMLTGKIFKIEFSAVSSLQVVLVWDEESKLVKAVTHGSGDFVYENLLVMVREKRAGALSKGSRWPVVTINTTRWLVEAQTRPFRSYQKGMTLLNFQVNPLYDADHDAVAPHGLIGQSWDGDGMAVDGAQDDYTTTEVTTKAMAEGAIEGTAADYEMDDKFSTDFKYSRFNSVAAKPRDVSKLTGVRKEGNRVSQAGATPDIDDLEQAL